MTGTGTQENPYIPGTLSELLTAISSANAYVKMPEGGGLIDANDEYPEGVPQTTMRCSELDGSGWIVKNIHNTASGTPVFNIDAWNNGNVTFKNISFTDMYVTGANIFSLSTSVSGDFNYRFENVTISGELYSGVVFRVYHTYARLNRCSVNFNLSGTAALVVDNVDQFISQSCHFRLSGTTSNDLNTGVLINSLLDGGLRNTGSGRTLRLSYASETSVVNIALDGFGSASYSGSSPVIINTDIVGSASVGGGFIGVTAQQLSDAQFLHDQGFPIGVE